MCSPGRAARPPAPLSEETARAHRRPHAAAAPAAAGELLTLQRAAYVTEAQLYDDVRLPALVQTLEDLVGELAESTCLAAVAGTRLVGAVRTRERDGVLHVGRLVVAPDLQGQGIGT